LASGSHDDETILLWDLATNRPRGRLGVPPEPVISLAFSPDGHWLASIGDRGRHGRLWDLEGRQGDRPLEALSRARDPLAFSPDGRLLATAGEDGAVRLLDLATGVRLCRVGGPDDRLTGVAFSPDGRSLAATWDDADIRLWDLGDLLKPRAEP
jgi:WD40 repeat protein